jgi:hypothetical protein
MCRRPKCWILPFWVERWDRRSRLLDEALGKSSFKT